MELLQKLSNANGPSGNEQEVRSIIEHEMRKFVDEVKTDKFGNLICHKKGKGPRVLLAAHMDEIGLMVKKITEEGHLKFALVGGIDPISLIGQRVTLLSQAKKFCNGVITSLDLHEDYPTTELPKIENMYIDTGLGKKEVQKIGVGIGTFAVPSHHFTFLGTEKIISGKALDDRIGCYILIKLAERLKQVSQDVFYVFTVQEEIGLYGAQTAVYQIDPDWAIAVDVTNAEDSESEDMMLGKGPAVTVMDAEMMSNQCINEWLTDIGKKNSIPLQYKVDEEGTTDAARLRLSRGGVPTTTVGVAIRNLHSTISVGHMDDIEHCIKLLYHLLKKPPRVCMV